MDAMMTIGPWQCAGAWRPVSGLRQGGEKADHLRSARYAHDLDPDVNRLGVGEIQSRGHRCDEASHIDERAANLVADISIHAIPHDLALVIDPGHLGQASDWGIKGSEGPTLQEEAVRHACGMRLPAITKQAADETGQTRHGREV